jgi:hypothetical protein
MLPASSIKKLNDHFGQYSVHVQCRRCKHGRDIQPAALARIFGWEAELQKIIPRMRCSRCDKKDIEVTIGFDRKPRKWDQQR